MTTPFSKLSEHDLDLALEALTSGASDADRRALDALGVPETLEELEHSLTAIHLASLDELEAPPSDLMVRLTADALGRCASPAPAPPVPAPAPTPVRSPWLLASAGWLAAAVLLVATLLQLRPESAPSVAELRDSLLADAGDAVRLDWANTDDPLSAGVTGDVVWSSARDEGYMRFRSLATNDPEVAQYQLWIFDRSRPDWEAKPVDGGVFDVAPGAEAIVRIDPKLDVSDAALFAVTLEQPGGVVVSERERIIVTAAPE